MNIKKLEENSELLSEKVHDAWQKEKLSQWFHSPNKCLSDNRQSYEKSDWREQKIGLMIILILSFINGAINVIQIYILMKNYQRILKNMIG